MAGSPLLLATSNPGKRRELLACLPPETEVITLAELNLTLPPEVGNSFVEIASAKASFAGQASGLITLADDSGLEVDALSGAPGVRSARYAGDPPDDARNRARLLTELVLVSLDQRSARFHCAVALFHPDGRLETGTGSCSGSIGFEEIGDNGFGYDSIFRLPDGRTMAELEESEKNRISHRTRAFEVIAATVSAWLYPESNGSHS